MMSIQQLRRSPEIAAAAANSRAFKRGEKGPHIALYQLALYSLGHDLPRSTVATKPRLEFDGIFGEETEEETRQFQTEQMLKDDGIVGEQTVFSIFTTVGLLPLVVPHNPDALSRAQRVLHSRAAVAAALAENFIERMDFYLGTINVSSHDYRRMRQHLAARRLTVCVVNKKRFRKIKDNTPMAMYDYQDNTILLRRDLNYFTTKGQATCIHELTHAVMDDRKIPIPTTSRDEAIAYLGEAFYLMRRFNMTFGKPSVNIPSIYAQTQPLIDAVLSKSRQKPEDIKALQMEVLRLGYEPLANNIHDGIR
jgi:hypothetical protein